MNLKTITNKVFKRKSREDELKRLEEISEQAKRFEQAVIESFTEAMNTPSPSTSEH